MTNGLFREKMKINCIFLCSKKCLLQSCLFTYLQYKNRTSIAESENIIYYSQIFGSNSIKSMHSTSFSCEFTGIFPGYFYVPNKLFLKNIVKKIPEEQLKFFILLIAIRIYYLWANLLTRKLHISY